MKKIIVLISVIISNVSFSQIDYTKFEGEKSKISIFKEYEYANLYDYASNSSKKDSVVSKQLLGVSPEALLTNKFNTELAINTKDSISFTINLVTRFKINIDNQNHTFISYTTSKTPSVRVVDFVYNDKQWIENTNENEQINYLKVILKNVNAFILFQFYNDEDNSNYPEINRLKVLAKNKEGILDIKKLAKVIEENKVSLIKYK